jgi:hypothetical protein
MTARALRLGKPAGTPRAAKADCLCPSIDHQKKTAAGSAKIDAHRNFRICSARVQIQLTLRETLNRSDVGPLAPTVRTEDMRFVYVLRSDVDRRRYYSGITSDVRGDWRFTIPAGRSILPRYAHGN